MIARVLMYVLAAVIVAGLVSTPQSTVVDDALRGLAVGAALLLPIALLYAAARSPQGHQRRHMHGRARFAAVGLCLVVGLSGLALQCRPNLPPVSGCAPYARRCNGDFTEVCSAQQRWHSDGDVPCARLEQVCIEGACVDPPDAAAGDASTDGGAQ